MAAISGVLFQLCNAGDHIISSNTIYGGSYALMHDFLPVKAGVTTTLYQQLLEQGDEMVESVRLDHLTHEHLSQEIGESVARRYLICRQTGESPRSVA